MTVGNPGGGGDFDGLRHTGNISAHCFNVTATGTGTYAGADANGVNFNNNFAGNFNNSSVIESNDIATVHGYNVHATTPPFTLAAISPAISSTPAPSKV